MPAPFMFYTQGINSSATQGDNSSDTESLSVSNISSAEILAAHRRLLTKLFQGDEFRPYVIPNPGPEKNNTVTVTFNIFLQQIIELVSITSIIASTQYNVTIASTQYDVTIASTQYDVTIASKLRPVE